MRLVRVLLFLWLKMLQTIMTARQLLSILRLSQSLARIRFLEEVTSEEVDEVSSMRHQSSMATHIIGTRNTEICLPRYREGRFRAEMWARSKEKENYVHEAQMCVPRTLRARGCWQPNVNMTVK